MPPFSDALICGISTQLQQEGVGFDEIIEQQDNDFSSSGLVADSLIRLGFLAVIPRNKIIGSTGSIAATRHRRLLENLSNHLIK
jgi:mRNA interferase MazF